jgi:DNA-binding NarL/FixJ family response regulator
VRDLTFKEREVLDKLVEGKTLKQAANELRLCYGTASRRIWQAKVILGAHTTAEAVLFYAKGRP